MAALLQTSSAFAKEPTASWLGGFGAVFVRHAPNVSRLAFRSLKSANQDQFTLGERRFAKRPRK